MNNPEVLEYKLDLLAEQLNRVEKLLSGNGEPEKGLVVKVDRLEQSYTQQELRRQRHLKATYTALTTLAVWLAQQTFWRH